MVWKQWVLILEVVSQGLQIHRRNLCKTYSPLQWKACTQCLRCGQPKMRVQQLMSETRYLISVGLPAAPSPNSCRKGEDSAEGSLSLKETGLQGKFCLLYPSFPPLPGHCAPTFKLRILVYLQFDPSCLSKSRLVWLRSATQ